MDEDRCRGHCCHAYSLDAYSLFTRNYKRVLKQVQEGHDTIDNLNFLQVYEMSIPLEPFVATESLPDNPRHPLSVSYPLSNKFDDRPGDPSHYRCKHVKENGDCGIYASRPETCRHYPNGHRCHFVHCGSVIFKNWGATSHVASGGHPFVPLERFVSSAVLRACRAAEHPSRTLCED